MQEGAPVIKSRNSNHHNMAFASNALLTAFGEKQHIVAAREKAAVCVENLERMLGQKLGATDSARGYIDQMYIAFKGDDTTWEGVKRIHASYRWLSAKFGSRLAEIGRSVVSIAPMLAIPLNRTSFNLEAMLGNGGSTVKFPVSMTCEGYAVRFDAPAVKGWLEIGSLDGHVGVIRAFEGIPFTTATGHHMTDKVRVVVMPSAEATARCLDDAVEAGDGTRVAEIVAGIATKVIANPNAFWDAVKAAKSLYTRRFEASKAIALGGDVVMQSRFGEAFVPAEPERVDEHEAHEEVLRLEREQLEAELAKLNAEIDGNATVDTAAAAAVTEITPEVVAAVTEIAPAAEAVLPPLPGAPLENLVEVTWYRANGETTLSTSCPGEGWSTTKPETAEETAGKAAAQAVALDDAVASAAANDPEAAAALKRIEDEVARRALATSGVELAAAAAVSGDDTTAAPLAPAEHVEESVTQ